MMTSSVKSDNLFVHFADISRVSAEFPHETVDENPIINREPSHQEPPAEDGTPVRDASAQTDDLIGRYFGEIRQYDLLNVKAERALWRRIEHHKGRMRRTLYLSPIALATLIRLWNQLKHGELSLQNVTCSETNNDVDTGDMLTDLSNTVSRLHELAVDLRETRGGSKNVAMTTAERNWRRHERVRLLRLWVQDWEELSLQPGVYDTLRADLERAVADQPDNRSLRAADCAWTAAKRQLDAATDQMLRANLRLVIHVARRFRDSSVPLLDLIQEGNLGLMRAIEKFDPHRDVKFVTYGHWWIRQAIGRAVINQGRTVRLPEHVVQRQQKIRIIKNNLQQQTGQAPTSQEISVALGWKPKDVEQLELDLQGAISLEQSFFDGERPVVDFIVDPTANDLSATAESEGLKQCLESCFDQLSAREAFILRRRFGFDNEKPQSLRIVGEELGISRERVRQIEKATLQRIRESSMMTQLADFVGH